MNPLRSAAIGAAQENGPGPQLGHQQVPLFPVLG